MYSEKLVKKAKKLGVSPEVYLYLRRSNRKIRYFTYDLKTEKIIIDGERITIIPEREDSLDRLEEKGGGIATEEESVEDIVIASMMREQLRDAISRLSDAERRLIAEIFFSHDGDGKTEREAAQTLGIPQKTLNERKLRILDKLKMFLENEK